MYRLSKKVSGVLPFFDGEVRNCLPLTRSRSTKPEHHCKADSIEKKGDPETERGAEDR
jgi:hypothetical protein